MSLKGVTEGFPFDDVTLVFKVMGKMFALSNLGGDPSLNLKCDPERALELRTQYPEIKPGWHMNKQHWNTIIVEGSVPEKLIYELKDELEEFLIGANNEDEIFGELCDVMNMLTQIMMIFGWHNYDGVQKINEYMTQKMKRAVGDITK